MKCVSLSILGNQSLVILGLALRIRDKGPRHVDASAGRRDMGKVLS